jgi:hypothetical protein
MYSFGAPTFQREKFHHESLLLPLHLSPITYFMNHKYWERFISFCDYLYGNFYYSSSGMVPPDDTRRWNRHGIECAWRRQGAGDSLYPRYKKYIKMNKKNNETARKYPIEQYQED